MKKEFDRGYITDLIYSARERVRERGLQYYKERRVVYAEMDFRKREAYFKVQGSAPEPYNVIVKNITSPAISVSCDCPYQTEHKELCKHSVAALYYLRNHFDQMLDAYNKKYYPEHPALNFDVSGLNKLIETYRLGYPEQYDFGKLLYKYNHSYMDWVNPVIWHARFIVNDRHLIIFKNFTTAEFPRCTCGAKVCEHGVASALHLRDFLQSEKYKALIKAKYRRKNGRRQILIGHIFLDEFESNNLYKRFNYLPEDYTVEELKVGYIRLKLKVRYQYVTTRFYLKGRLIYSDCSCNDPVEGMCKHQIAALNMFLNLNPRFFYYFGDESAFNFLKMIFV